MVELLECAQIYLVMHSLGCHNILAMGIVEEINCGIDGGCSNLSSATLFRASKAYGNGGINEVNGVIYGGRSNLSGATFIGPL